MASEAILLSPTGGAGFLWILGCCPSFVLHSEVPRDTEGGKGGAEGRMKSGGEAEELHVVLCVHVYQPLKPPDMGRCALLQCVKT